jgi:hypothetical protein
MYKEGDLIYVRHKPISNEKIVSIESDKIIEKLNTYPIIHNDCNYTDYYYNVYKNTFVFMGVKCLRNMENIIAKNRVIIIIAITIFFCLLVYLIIYW